MKYKTILKNEEGKERPRHERKSSRGEIFTYNKKINRVLKKQKKAKEQEQENQNG